MKKPCFFSGLMLVACVVGLSGCASVNNVFCKAEHEEPKIAALMRDSCEGDRLAAMQLGLWFEGQAQYGDAVRYYKIASTPSGGRNYVYVPPAGDVPGFTMPVDGGIRQEGLPEAQYRLGMMYLKGQGIEADSSKARKYFQRAAEQGHGGAKVALKSLTG